MKLVPLTAAAFFAATSVFAAGVPGGHFVENWDLDGNGSVSLAEVTERRSDIFATFDANENGSLDAEEYADFDEARRLDMESNGAGEGHGKGGMKMVQQGMKLNFNDADGDGVVTQDEFMAAVPKWFAMMDRTGDGVVDTQDFAKR